MGRPLTRPDGLLKRMHHAPGGGFRNPWPEAPPLTPGGIVQVVRDHQRGTREWPSPPRNSLPVESPAIVYPRRVDDKMSATWIGHSTVLLQIGDVNVLTDPVFCQRAFPVQWMGPRRIMDAAIAVSALPPIDFVLISHNHYDHLDRGAVRQIARANPQARWIVPLGLRTILRRWGAWDVVELDWWHQTEINAVRITALPACHFSSRYFADRNQSLWCGFSLEIAGKRIFFAGDTAYHPEFSEISAICGPFDFVLIPIGAYDPRWAMQFVHANAEEAVQIYRDLTAPHPDAPLPVMLAIHWGTFRLTAEPVDEPPRRTSARWKELELDADKLWIACIGETRELT